MGNLFHSRSALRSGPQFSYLVRETSLFADLRVEATEVHPSASFDIVKLVIKGEPYKGGEGITVSSNLQCFVSSILVDICSNI